MARKQNDPALARGVIERALPWSVVRAVRLWSEQVYAPFLTADRAPTIDSDWLRWYLKSWAIARTVRAGRQDALREYLNGADFRSMVRKDSDGSSVDVAAAELGKRRIAAMKSSGGSPVRPVSMVSKIAFVLRPEHFVPLDRFGRDGMKALGLLGAATGGDASSYRSYWQAFEGGFAQSRRLIEDELRSSWVQTMAERLGCRKQDVRSTALARKVFDNILMSIGGREF